MTPYNSTLDIMRYEAARDTLAALSGYFVAAAIFVTMLLLLSSAQRSIRPMRFFVGASALLLTAGMGALAWFHFELYRSFVIVDPATGTVLAYAKIPLWVESEKLYFWSFIYSFFIFAYLGQRLPGIRLARSLTVMMGGMLLLVVTISNPFANPLPGLHAELLQIVSGMQSGNNLQYAQAYEMAIGRLKYFYGSPFMWIHPPLLFVAYGAFLITFCGNILMFFFRDKEIERTSTSWARFGYLVLTVGMLVGYPWAVEAWQGTPWWWSPKINVSIVMWVLYTAYLHSRLYLMRHSMWSLTACLGFLSFLALVFNYVSTYLIPGVHSYG